MVQAYAALLITNFIFVAVWAYLELNPRPSDQKSITSPTERGLPGRGGRFMNVL